MAPIKLKVNGKTHAVEAVPDMPLLWVVRDFLGLKGTKYGCGVGQCGSCVVLLEGNPVRSCTLPVTAVGNREVTTIEGVSEENQHPVQQALIEEQAPQCGYCYSGQVLTALALLKENPTPSEDEVNAALDTVICRCGSYPRIRKAISRAIETINKK